MDCTCYGPEAMSKIAGGLRSLDVCQYELTQHKNYTDSAEKTAWYQSPTMIVGGVVVGVGLAGVLGFLIGSHK